MLDSTQYQGCKEQTAVLGVLRTALWETQIQVKQCCREEKELGLIKRKKISLPPNFFTKQLTPEDSRVTPSGKDSKDAVLYPAKLS